MLARIQVQPFNFTRGATDDQLLSGVGLLVRTVCYLLH